MTGGPRWRRYLRFIRPDVAADVSDELEFHIGMRVADYMRNGMSAEEARALALARFGAMAPVRDTLVDHDRRHERREHRRERIADLLQDIRFGWRSLGRAPGFAAAIVVTLALAVGANAAVFSLVDPLLFRPPPGVVDPGSVRRLYANFPNVPSSTTGHVVSATFSYPEYVGIRAGLAGYAQVAAYLGRDSMVITRGRDSTFANVTYATADFLPLLGAQLVSGRSFTETEDDVHAPAPVAVISERFARRLFGVGVDPIGQSLRVRDTRYDVIGVVRDGFGGIDESAAEIWAPFGMQPRYSGGSRQPWYTTQEAYILLIARIGHGVGDRVVETRATLSYVRARTSTSKRDQGRSVLVGSILPAQGPTSARQEVTIATRLAVVAAIVLLIAMANISNLLLARALRRRREIAVRLSLGISRRRLAAQLLTESMILALLAGVAATIVAAWGGGVLRVALLPRTQWIEAPVGGRVLVFTAVVAVGAALLAAIVPAIVVTRMDLAQAHKSGSRGITAHRSRVRGGLLIVQAAFSVVLLVGSALFALSLRNLHGVDLGFDDRHLVIGSLFFGDAKGHPERGVLLPQLAERMALIPGVEAATYAIGGPLNSWINGPLFLATGDSSRRSDVKAVNYIGVSPDYFTVVGTKVLAGRAFLPSDQSASRPVMVVSTALANALWAGRSPIGECLIPDQPTNPCYTVVGVVQDAHALQIVEKPGPTFYLPLTQMPIRGFLPNALLVRARTDASGSIAATMGAELRQAFPTAQVTARTANDILAPQLRPWRLGAQLFTALSLLALVIAAIGVYSVVAFSVRERQHELGVRIALGARTSDLLRLVVQQGTKMVAIGVALGIVGALATGKFVASLLYGVSPRDPLAMAVAAAILLAVGALASLLPAWRASQVDPTIVLRDE